jgi:Fe-S cluster assembly protein SufD
MSNEVAKAAQSESVVNWVAGVLADAAKSQSTLNLSPRVAGLISGALRVWGGLYFPTPKLEAWKYTNPDVIAKGPFAWRSDSLPVGHDTEIGELLNRVLLADLADSSVVTFVDGVFSAKHSRIVEQQGVSLKLLSQSGFDDSFVGELGQHSQDAFSALATALISDCVAIKVSRDVQLKSPIQIAHISTRSLADNVITPRTCILAECGAKVSVIESHIGSEGVRYLSLPMTELKAEQGAFVDYYKVQDESISAYHVAGLTALQERDAQVRAHIFSFGGALVRNNAQTLLSGTGSQSTLNGLSVLRGEQHVDNATLIHHIEPHSESREHFKGIYAGSSRGVFSGTITVEKIAQKTNAFQSNQALLLSTDASIESRPQLKIWADDVKCTHGATVGQLDENALFYLRSRGVGLKDARAFLVRAFAGEVLSSVLVPQLKERLNTLVGERL